MTRFAPFAWTRRQQDLVDRTAAWVESGRSDATLLTAEQLAEVDSWVTPAYPGIDENVLQYLARSRENPKKGESS